MAKGRNDGKPSKTPEFLVKLRRMLLDEPREVIEYKSGRIYFHDPQKLLDGILRKYFKHNNFSSLHRQLNYFEYMKVKGKGTVEPCMYENTGMLGQDINRLLLLKRKKPLISGGSKGGISSPSKPPIVGQNYVNKGQLKSEVVAPLGAQTGSLYNDDKQCDSQIISKDRRQDGTPKGAKLNCAWPPTPMDDEDLHNRWVVQGGLTPTLASCPPDLKRKHQVSCRRISGNVKGFSRDWPSHEWSWPLKAKDGVNTSKERVNHADVHEMHEQDGVIMPAGQVTDQVDGSGGWKDREGARELNKMYQHRSSDMEIIDDPSLDLEASQVAVTPRSFSSPHLPYSPQALPSPAVRNWVNPHTIYRVPGKGIRSVQQACSLPLDATTNITDTKGAASNPLPYMSPPANTSHMTPRSSGSEDGSNVEQKQSGGLFWRYLGWSEPSDINVPSMGGAPKSAEAPQYSSTYSMVSPAAFRNLPGAILGTDDILITPSTLSCFEEDHDIFQPNLVEAMQDEFGYNQFPSPFLREEEDSGTDDWN